MPVVEYLFLAYFVYVVFYNLFFSLAGLFYKNPSLASSETQNKKFGIFIPAYKEDAVIIDVAKRALQQNYPDTHYHIVVIADSLKPSTIEILRNLPITLIEVSFAKSTKVKSLNTALDKFQEEFDYAVILDADNVMDPNFVAILNNLHQQGYNVIQGRRAAKNSDNPISFLDALSEEINNHIVGKGSKTLALSPGLKGSGMSFEFALLKESLLKIQSVGGFDRELELKLLEVNSTILYAYNASVLDEKIARIKDFENQRKRWISSQFYYLRKYFFRGIKMLFKGNLSYFNSSILRNIQLPRVLNLGILFLFALVTTIGKNVIPFHYYLWIALFLLNCLSLAIAIPKHYYGKQLLKSFLHLPAVFWKMVRILLKMKGANDTFIHTPHTSSDKNKPV